MLFQHLAKFIEALIFIFGSISTFLFYLYDKLSGISTTSLSLIVRPAVSRVLAPLKGGLKHRDWAGLTEYTSPLGFALSYVFDKQSGSPCYCDLQMP